MLEIALIYLAAAIVAVPIAKRVGLGSVLGYLIAGILIGPYALGIVGDQTDVMHFAEFGVVMMLFLVGLELQPARLWKLRHSILGLGGLQVVLTAAAIFAFCYWVFTMHWQTALAIGLMLALSSTAIVLQSLEEKGWLKQEAGQNAFSVLLFQDIAIIPILALLPLLAFAPQSSSKDISDSIIASWPVWQQVGVSVAVIAAIIAGGKYVSAPLFRYIAQTHMREIFTIFALFLVVTVPSNLMLDIDDGSGDIAISAMQNNINVEDGSGSLSINSAKNLTIEDGSGDITLENITGNLAITDGSGSVNINNVSGNAVVDDGSGDMRISNVRGTLTVEDGSGSIAINNINGAVDVDDNSGDLVIEHVQASVTIEDGSGDIRVNHAMGLTITESGSGDVSIDNINGPVKVAD